MVLPWDKSNEKNSTKLDQISHPIIREKLHRLGIFNADHSRGDIYSPPKSEKRILEHGFQSLSLFPTDQIWLAPLLADRNAVLLHSSAAIINGKGLVFVGHSGAGKTTTMNLLKQAQIENNLDIQILCDDRNVCENGLKAGVYTVPGVMGILARFHLN